MKILSLIGAALLASVLAFTLKKNNSAFAAAVAAAGGIAVAAAAFSYFAPSLKGFLSLSGGAYSEYISVLVRALGVGFIVQICGDICRDLGEATLAGKIELVGKLEIMLLCLPQINSLLSLSYSIVEG